MAKIIDRSMQWTRFGAAPLDDVQHVVREFFANGNGVPDRVLGHLKLLEGDTGGFPVDRLEHCLQSATRAHEAGESEAYVVCALLHDIGDTLATFNHPAVAAAILKPYVSPELHWMIEKHDVFQGYYFWDKIGLDKNARDAFRDHPSYADSVRFVALYDDPSFDPNYKSHSLEAFAPIVRRVMSKPIHGAAAQATF